MVEQQAYQDNTTDEEVLAAISELMGKNSPSSDFQQNIHTFLNSIATSSDTTKTANLSIDKDFNELGVPANTVRGGKELALISKKIMITANDYFQEYFEEDTENTLATSLSKEGFLVKQGTTQTKQVADITRRRKIKRGWFGKEEVEDLGGDTTGVNNNPDLTAKK